MLRRKVRLTLPSPYYKIINRLSANFALTADMCLGLLAGDIKRKEMLSGRLADIHAHLFIASSILKYFEHSKKTEDERLHAQLAVEKSLYTAQEAFLTCLPTFHQVQQQAWSNCYVSHLAVRYRNHQTS